MRRVDVERIVPDAFQVERAFVSNAGGIPAVRVAAAGIDASSSAAESPDESGFDAPDSLIAQALRRSPDIEALQRRIEAARERARAAGAPADPMAALSLSGMNLPGGDLGSDPMAMAGIEISQAFTLPGKLHGRRRAAEAESRALEAEWSAARRALAAETREMYADLYAFDREDESLRGSLAAIDLLFASADARYSSGGDEMGTLARVQLERLRIEERLDDLVAERSARLAQLNALLDRPSTAGVRTDSLALAVSVTGIPADLAAVVAQAPEVEIARMHARAAEERLRVERLERWPDLVAGVEYGYRGALDPLVTAKLGIELPLWKGRKQDAAARAAGHDVEAARAELHAAELKARAEAERAIASLRAADRQVRRYREEIVPRAQLAFASSRAAYETGGSDATTMLLDLQALVDAHAAAGRRAAERYAAWARWKLLEGGASVTEGAQP